MQIIGHETTYNHHDKNNRPTAHVQSGETFLVKTELTGGTWLQSEKDIWNPTKSCGPNLTVCVAVEDAHPGDTLCIEILDIRPDNIGYTGFAGWRNPLSQKIWPNDWDIVTKTVSIRDGFVLWGNNLKIPVQPMIGTLGTAPSGDAFLNKLSGITGGNMDTQEVCKGTTVYLPVQVENALLHIGDTHAVMGDGEINRGGGIECRSDVTLKVTVLKNHHQDFIRMTNQDYIMAFASDIDPYKAFQLSVRELISFMCEDYGFCPQEAYLLLGQVLEARGTALLCDEGQTKSYIAKIKKQYLTPDPDFRPNPSDPIV